MRLRRRDLLSAALGVGVTLAVVTAVGPRQPAPTGEEAAGASTERPAAVDAPGPASPSPAPSPGPSTEPGAAASSAADAAPSVDVDGRFVATFDGAPSAPAPWDGADWDVAVHSRDLTTWEQLEEVDAHHGAGCEPPMATHAVTAYEDAVYRCKDHVMTAISALGYGVVYLTPDRMLDVSDEGLLRFDVSTLRTSSRDWLDVWITPYEDNLVLPLGQHFPDLSGPPADAVQLRMKGKNRYELVVYRDHEPEVHVQDFRTIDDVLEPSATERQTFELRISGDHVRFGMPEHDLWWVDAEVPGLPFDRGVVQLGHHSYNPTKGGGAANTWHWDDVVLEPAVPFTSIAADRRHVTSEGPTTVRFDRPAPSDAHLRFSGMGESFEVSFDDGATWEPAEEPSQIQSRGMQHRNYWTPVPEGATAVQVRGADGWFRDWLAKDFAVWSPQPPA